MRKDLWKIIESAFPRDDEVSSRIVVTTTVQTVAKASTFANVEVHIHKMGRLDKEKSEELFVKKACLEIHSEYGHPDSKRILEKCDGQPLALVSVGQFLRKKGWPTEASCDHVCRRLRHHLLEDEAFERMRRMLNRSYASLPNDAPKACLMYFGMFPAHHPIRRKSLMRLWLAEGFLGEQLSCGALDRAEENFSTLIDQNIIESIDVSNNSNVKTCKTYGMMREFISIKSIIWQGFIALAGNETLQTRPSNVRGLSLYHSSATEDSRLYSDLKHVRSLTVHGEASEAVLDFRKYELLRILDLEAGCTAGLGDDRLESICNLSLLKYLSFGGTVGSLPKEIEKLTLLETLDLKRTNVKILPLEVILLPSLVHLFGEFRLQAKRMHELRKFLKLGKSNVETLAGFITDGSDIAAEIMCHMKKLSKVKIRCNTTTSNDGGFTRLEDAIQKFIHDDNQESTEPRSLSLHFDKCSEDLLYSLKAPCYLSSLKVHGKLVKLPQFILSLRNLTELCLESTILTADLLANLGDLKYLKYLKLMARHLEDFIVKRPSFRRLLRLSLVLERPTLPTFNDGDLQYLSSLQLICKHLVGLSGMRIEYLHCLKDVTLHPEVTLATKEEWEQAAKRHPGRPKIFLQKADTTPGEPSDDSDSSGSDKSASTENSFALYRQAELGTDTQMLL
ncbi:disease resistance protein RGA4-like [Panicum virgatum]|nr:disease resistance protein RGA4-like [Panicum virgatum]